MLILAAAIHRCVCGPASVINYCTPTEIGHQSEPALVAIKGQSRAFHEPMNAKIVTVIMGALDRGSTT